MVLEIGESGHFYKGEPEVFFWSLDLFVDNF